MVSKIVAKSREVLLENYARVPIAMVRGSGSYIYDEDENQYIDLFAGFGAGGLVGHCHPAVAAAVAKQSQTLLSHGNLFTSEPQVLLAEKLISHSFKGKVFFCHSGAEADETAIKLCRKATSKEKYKLLCFDGCFHGRTMGGLSMCPEVFHTGFQPMLEGVIRIPFNDINAFDKVMDDTVAGVFVEPVQGEGGINIPSIEFMRHLQDRCNQMGALLICDEVWTSPARTGKWFGYQHFDIQPDAITVAKALGGGLPVGACIIAEKWQDVLGPGSHGCTMGGNPICASAALAAVEFVEQNDLVDQAAWLGSKTLSQLDELIGARSKSIRGKGLMIGVQLNDDIKAGDVVTKCLNNTSQRVIIGAAKNNVIRFAPAINIKPALLAEGVSEVARVVNSFN